MTPWSQDRYIKAYRFAAEAHQGQLLPDSTLPYLVHLTLVAMEVIAALAVETVHNGDLAVQCALLHDVIEDTSLTPDVLLKTFGPAVASGVLALSKDPALPPERRLQDSLRRIREQPKEIWMVKMADRITNLAPPPPSWSDAKIRQYREEARLIHETLGEGSRLLADRLQGRLARY